MDKNWSTVQDGTSGNEAALVDILNYVLYIRTLVCVFSL